MGRKKDKWTKKTVNFYRYIFKFEPPFKVLIDGNFVGISIRKKFDMKEKIKKLLGSDIHLIITSCVFNELQEFESKIPGLISAVSIYKIEECKHNTMSPCNCIKDYIGKKNMNKFFVVTQDNFLRAQLRKIPGVPLLFFDQNILMIEKISKTSIEASGRREELKEDPQKSEKKELTNKKKEIKEFLIDEFKHTKYYRDKIEQLKINKLMGKFKKAAKGPNPLSVKKKQSYYIQRDKDILYKQKLKEIEENKNNIGENAEFIKKKRHRSKKKKNVVDNIL